MRGVAIISRKYYRREQMTDKEAIKQLASLIINSQLFHQDEGDIWEKDIEALRIAIKAVEKQIPKKPITTADGYKA